MYDYNTSREMLKLREFGRNIQKLAQYLKTIESKEERNKYANALVELMKQIVPSAKSNQESNQILWDELHILTDYDLDVDSPYPKPEAHVDRKPESVGYSEGSIKFRHYGHNIELMIEMALKIEDKEQQEAAVFHIARLMKSFHVTWNNETPDNTVIAKSILALSDGELKLNLEKAAELDLLEPLYKDKPRPSGKPSGKGKSQGRRRRK
ncbi:MAG: DUF4290 domain-containing protein [Bacteroidota bacterium]